ncbi:MAG: tryptophan synthase subunit alpha [Euzebya sp.]
MSVLESIRSATSQGRAALIIYLPAGFPDMETSQECLEAAAEGGADLIEVGFPYSDPLMDGPVIQAANQVALDSGYTPFDDIQMCARLTANVDVPVVVMTYYNIAWHYGGVDQLAHFATDCKDAGLVGAILPDLPTAEGGPWRQIAADAGLQTIFLASPTSTEEGIRAVAESSTGFVYATSTMGVTGVRQSLSQRAEPLVKRIRQATDKPVCVGIGVSTPDHAREVAGFADGVIVGSAAVEAARDGGPKGVRQLVKSLAEGVLRASSAAG